jgi:16S rRNA (uracil1498-N3)-methyltransferase
MTRRRFYAPPAAFGPSNESVCLSVEESRHLREVLRLKAGDEAYVFDGEGAEYRCVVADAGRGLSGPARLDVRERVAPARAESPLRLRLAVALLKGDKFDLVVQKATELGVARIVPVATTRASVRLRDAGDATRRLQRWQRLAIEAAKQSGRARVPALCAPVSFTGLMEELSPAAEARCLIFAERGGRRLSETIAAWRARPAELTALVGPEGGWEDGEIMQATAAGCEAVTLGGRILRAETAAIVITALLQYRLGDLN